MKIEFQISFGFTAGHPWVQVDGVAPDKPLHSAVLSRMMQFSAMNKLKKMALRVCNLCVRPKQSRREMNEYPIWKSRDFKEIKFDLSKYVSHHQYIK